MPKSKSSARWLKEHFDDIYVKQAQREGYRSRAAYKLLEIQQRDKLLRPGLRVLDLGAAPGGWSQVAASHVGVQGQIVAVDLLPMQPLSGVAFIQGDVREQAVLDQVAAALGGRAHLVLADMAPNITGMRSVDNARVLGLAELAVDFSADVLQSGGDLLMKIFQGSGFEQLQTRLRTEFGRVMTRKPHASRARSSEVYILARNYKLV